MKTQRASIPHLVMGLVFVGVAAAWALHEAGVIGSVQVQWLLPLVLVVAGTAGLLAAVVRGVDRDRPEETLVTDDGPVESS